jgi:uncharacterized protein (DUF2164 family)
MKLEKSVHAYLIGSIRRFFSEHLDEEIGDLKAERVLEFCVKEIGPSVYNQAIADARAYFQKATSDLGDIRYEAEFDFWKKKR